MSILDRIADFSLCELDSILDQIEDFSRVTFQTQHGLDWRLNVSEAAFSRLVEERGTFYDHDRRAPTPTTTPSPSPVCKAASASWPLGEALANLQWKPKLQYSSAILRHQGYRRLKSCRFIAVAEFFCHPPPPPSVVQGLAKLDSLRLTLCAHGAQAVPWNHGLMPPRTCRFLGSPRPGLSPGWPATVIPAASLS